jgi:hypothetical protein
MKPIRTAAQRSEHDDTSAPAAGRAVVIAPVYVTIRQMVLPNDTVERNIRRENQGGTLGWSPVPIKAGEDA